MIAFRIELGTVGEWLSGIGAAAAVIVAVISLKRAQASERIAAGAAAEAGRAADAAQAAVNLAARSRIDERSAHLSVEVGRGWHEYSYTKQQSFFANDPRPWQMGQSTLDEPFYAGDDFPGWLFVQFRGTITNEGTTSVFVRLDGEANFGSIRSTVGQPRARDSLGREILLAPGEYVEFTWWAGHPMKEWVAASSGDEKAGHFQLVVTARDPHGRYVDHITLSGNGRPLVAETGMPGYWRVDIQNAAAVVAGARRTYLALGETIGGER